MRKRSFGANRVVIKQQKKIKKKRSWSSKISKLENKPTLKI